MNLRKLSQELEDAIYVHVSDYIESLDLDNFINYVDVECVVDDKIQSLIDNELYSAINNSIDACM